MTLQTRKPTGHASYPLILLAGVEGAGKTWAAVEASSAPTVDRAFFLEIGEGMADEYGAVPGADFEIIEHDGTLGQIREAISEVCVIQPAAGKHNLLIVDSMSEVWALLSDNAQREANARARRKGRGGDDAQIGMDLWNRATDTWEGLLRQLRGFPGPVVMTARLDVVTLMDDAGKPTKAKDWKIQAQKRLPYRVTVVVQAREPRRWTLTKIATTVPALALEPGKVKTFDDFSVTKLLDVMGIAGGMDASTFQGAEPDDALSDERVEKAAQHQRQQEAEAERNVYVRRVQDSLLAAEAAGDEAKIVKWGEYLSSKGDGELVQVARKILDRLRASQPMPTDEPVVEGEVVDDGSDPA